jgi:hypothetical protein
MPSPKKLQYTYDFGSSTLLDLLIVGQRPAPAPTWPAVRMLARNDPIEWPCTICNTTAVEVCRECDSAFYCSKHAGSHSCGEEWMLPVVDSPRMGVCDYTGPSET